MKTIYYESKEEKSKRDLSPKMDRDRAIEKVLEKTGEVVTRMEGKGTRKDEQIIKNTTIQTKQNFPGP